MPNLYVKYPITVFVLAIAAMLMTNVVFAKTKNFDGHWKINHAETDKVTPKTKEGSGVQGNLGRFKPTIDIGLGLPLPKKIGGRPYSSLAPQDPKVLGCTTMQLQQQGKKVNVLYDSLDKETLVKGDYRGRKTKISSRQIQQNYKTGDRKVTKTWAIRDDGRLLVTVKLNPKKDKARTFLRVFDRVSADALQTRNRLMQLQKTTVRKRFPARISTLTSPG